MVQNPPGRTGACSMAKLICYPRPKWTLSMKKPIESWLLSTLIFQVTPSPARPKVRVTRPTLGNQGRCCFYKVKDFHLINKTGSWGVPLMKSILDNLVEGNDNTNWWTSTCNTWADASEQPFHASRPAREQYKQAANQLRVYYRCPLSNQLLN